VLENRDISKGKQFQRGLAQLEEEGAIQVLYPEVGTRSEPILAAVGELQFDVVMSRLNDEYNVPTHIRHMEHTTARWVADEAAIGAGRLPQNTIRTRDTSDRLVLVFPSDWALSYFERENQDVQLSDVH
jgi:peptide chain release factor 3